MLITIDNVLTAEELALGRQLLAEAQWASGQITAGTQAVSTLSMVMSIVAKPLWLTKNTCRSG
jgi:predicted 2-oxoglutarate/Fe(II)-dependent dioxygenase YbiX